MVDPISVGSLATGVASLVVSGGSLFVKVHKLGSESRSVHEKITVGEEHLEKAQEYIIKWRKALEKLPTASEERKEQECLIEQIENDIIDAQNDANKYIARHPTPPSRIVRLFGTTDYDTFGGGYDERTNTILHKTIRGSSGARRKLERSKAGLCSPVMSNTVSVPIVSDYDTASLSSSLPNAGLHDVHRTTADVPSVVEETNYAPSVQSRCSRLSAPISMPAQPSNPRADIITTNGVFTGIPLRRNGPSPAETFLMTNFRPLP